MDASTLRLCLGLRLHAAGFRARARLASGRNRGGARRRRLDHGLPARPSAIQQVLDLVARQRLELEETLGKQLQLVALGLEDDVRLAVARLDQPPDFRVDLLGGRFGNVLLPRYGIAEEDL